MVQTLKKNDCGLMDSACETVNVKASECNNAKHMNAILFNHVNAIVLQGEKFNNECNVSPPRSLMYGQQCSTMSVEALRMNNCNWQIQHESPSMSKQINATMSKHMNATVFTHVDSTMIQDGNATTGGRYIRQDHSCIGENVQRCGDTKSQHECPGGTT